MSSENDSQVGKAVDLIQRGRVKEAIEILRITLQSHPESLEGWYNLGYALMLEEDLDGAVKAYDEALAIDNGVFEIWYNKATALYELRDFEKAKQCYETALEINPDDAEAWNNLGNCYSRLADGKAAIEAYTRAVALRPDYAEAFYNKANAHFIEDELEKAIAYADLAMELNPGLADMVAQWIKVAQNRLASQREHEEFMKRKEGQENSDD